jgi:hypothetical protein
MFVVCLRFEVLGLGFVVWFGFWVCCLLFVIYGWLGWAVYGLCVKCVGRVMEFVHCEEEILDETMKVNLLKVPLEGDLGGLAYERNT